EGVRRHEAAGAGADAGGSGAHSPSRRVAGSAGQGRPPSGPGVAGADAERSERRLLRRAPAAREPGTPSAEPLSLVQVRAQRMRERRIGVDDLVIDALRPQRRTPLIDRVLHRIAVLATQVRNADRQLFARLRVDEAGIADPRRELALARVDEVKDDNLVAAVPQ